MQDIEAGFYACLSARWGVATPSIVSANTNAPAMMIGKRAVAFALAEFD